MARHSLHHLVSALCYTARLRVMGGAVARPAHRACVRYPGSHLGRQAR